MVLNDFLITTPSLAEAKDLLKVIDDRSQLRSTVVVTQLTEMAVRHHRNTRQ